MDPSRFDELIRLLGRSGGRRAVLGTLFGALLGPAAANAARKRRKSRGQHKDKGRERDTSRDEDRERAQRLQAERRKGGKRKHKKKRRGGSGGQPEPPPPDCCGTDSCPNPEPGSTSGGCDFAGRSFVGQDHNGSLFRGIDGRGAIFTATDNHGSVFAEACLQGARFRRARLDDSTWGDACLFDADFTGADFGGDLTLFNDALFCHTAMPDGTVNDRDCGRATACCQSSPEPGPSCQSAADCADQPCQTKACQDGQCVYTVVADGASPNEECGANASGHCCEGVCCQGDATECNPSGLCCAPNCEGRECGPDGCGSGGSCGPGCRPGQTCDEDGQCTGVPSCTAQSCPNGCCDADGNCQPGNTFQSCGTGGESCEPCNDSRVCQDGRCVTCSPNCICQGQDFCADPDAPNATCFEREDGPECVCLVSRAGQPFCSGTQDASGFNCTTDVDCQSFASGSVCVDAAPSGSLCQTGNNFCAAPCCTPQNCSGCCIGGTCLPGTTREACGIDGEFCVDCSQGGDVCQNGQCVCTGESCPNGCCDAGLGNPGVCLAGTSADSCGTNGARCATCGSGQVCHNQECCAFDCTGKACGPDGCGGSCGSCPTGQTCNEQTGQCLCAASVCAGCCSNGPGNPGVCRVNQPNTCGTNGQQCVNCPPPGACNAQGQCVCTPDCDGNTCGPDGCGGSCGSCPPGEFCGDPIPGQCACDADSCPTGLQCCPAGGADRCLAVDGAPCDQSGDCCSSICCGGNCCAENQTCCGESCCNPGQFCCNGTCCNQPCCGNACCPPGGRCCSGVCCCGPGIDSDCCQDENGNETCCFLCNEQPDQICCGNQLCGLRSGASCQFPGFDSECCSNQCDSNSRCT